MVIGGAVPVFADQQTTPTPTPTPTPKPKQSMMQKPKSPDDGWIDISAFLDEKYGFLPIFVPITEPAVGFGGAAGLTFVQAPKAGAVQDAFARPNMTAVGGLG